MKKLLIIASAIILLTSSVSAQKIAKAGIWKDNEKGTTGVWSLGSDKVAEVVTKYDFSATKQWVDLQDQIDELKEKQKEVEKFCKGIKNKTITVDEETGESFEFYPPAKSSTTSIKKTIL